MCVIRNHTISSRARIGHPWESYRSPQGEPASLILDFSRNQYAMGAGGQARRTLPGAVSLSRASTATYFDALGVMQTAAIDVPRFDHDPVTHAVRGLLTEVSRTNLFLHSEDVSSSYWVKKEATIAANAAVAPDGSMTADAVIAAATNSQHYARSSTIATVVSETDTFSVCLKANGETTAAVFFHQSTSPYTLFAVAVIDLMDGSLSSITGTVSAQDVGNGWWRVSVEGAASSTGINARVDLRNLTGFAGDGVSGVYLWGAQFETGGGATSYIPTAGTATTRAADSVSVLDMGWYSDTEGTMVLSGEMTRGVPGGSGESFVSRAGGGLFSYTSGDSVLTTDGTNDLDAGSATGVLGYALKWSGSTMAASLNGATVVSGPYDGAFGVGPLWLGKDAPAAWLRRLIYYPVALSDAGLQALSGAV